MDAMFMFLGRIPWYAWIPILGIVAGLITRIVAMNHRHRERLEKIRHGMDPDAGRNPGR
ncbi:MAG: hypothetical protein U1A27_08650 [Phycisphaerae bacterium]